MRDRIVAERESHGLAVTDDDAAARVMKHLPPARVARMLGRVETELLDEGEADVALDVLTDLLENASLRDDRDLLNRALQLIDRARKHNKTKTNDREELVKQDAAVRLPILFPAAAKRHPGAGLLDFAGQIKARHQVLEFAC